MTIKLLAIALFAALASVVAIEVTGSQHDLLIDGPTLAKHQQQAAAS